MKRSIRLALLLAVVPLGAAVHAQLVGDVLELSAALEGRLLEQELARYDEARSREVEVLERVAALARDLDRALADSSQSIEDLRRRETELTAERDRAFSLLEESGALRRKIYDRMDRLAELNADLKAARTQEAADRSALDGTWRVAIHELEITARFEMRVDGALVTGTYHMSNGESGSIRGTFAGLRLVLQRIGAGRGFDAMMRGTLDPDSGRILGSWELLEVAGGTPAAGLWEAEKVAEP